MKFPFIWRRTADADLAVWKERAEQQRRRAERAVKTLRTEVSARRTIAELYADLCESHGLPVPVDAANPDRRQAVQAAARFDEAQARRAADRIARLQKAVARARTEAAAEGRRARAMQAQLDDVLGLNSPAVAAGSSWQQRREDKPSRKEATAS